MKPLRSNWWAEAKPTGRRASSGSFNRTRLMSWLEPTRKMKIQSLTSKAKLRDTRKRWLSYKWPQTDWSRGEETNSVKITAEFNYKMTTWSCWINIGWIWGRSRNWKRRSGTTWRKTSSLKKKWGRWKSGTMTRVRNIGIKWEDSPRIPVHFVLFRCWGSG